MCVQTTMSTAQWPTPRALEGVKSRKRAIFELEDEVVEVRSGQCKVSGISLTLESRVVAVGQAGLAAANVLLGLQKPSSGSSRKHDQLEVVHLGPHLADCDDIAGLLEAKPQVVVLSDDVADSQSNWAVRFRDIVRSTQVAMFQGALVICVEHEARLPHELCATRWFAEAGVIRAEQVGPELTIVIDDLCSKAEADASYRYLLPEVSELAAMCFDDTGEGDRKDIVTVALQHGWKVVALTVPDPTGVCSKGLLAGYLTYNIEAKLDGLCLQRVAISTKFRRRGFANQLVRWTVERAQTERCGSILVHAVPALQTINKALGFTYMDPADAIVPDAEKQSAWMEMEICKEVASATNVPAISRKKAKKEAAKKRR